MPTKYLPGPGLQAVIDLALKLNRPLLVTGEPGTGKTALARYVAQQKELDAPLVFNTKTDAEARDLFYSYDAIRHFRDASIPNKDPHPLDYVTFNALGKAIIESGTKRSVVLIDEIDKAPRDFPNDLLFELEEMAFQIKEATGVETKERLKGQVPVDEQGVIHLQDEANHPILIITSNSEKNLPDAFMRRVLYHHIEFPNPDRLEEIVNLHAPPGANWDQASLKAAITHFEDIRQNKSLRKLPATAELIAWIQVLQEDKVQINEALRADSSKPLKEALFHTYSLIAKNREDLATLKRDLGI
jgi:MoxR-like ATPase